MNSARGSEVSSHSKKFYNKKNGQTTENKDYGESSFLPSFDNKNPGGNLVGKPTESKAPEKSKSLKFGVKKKSTAKTIDKDNDSDYVES